MALRGGFALWGLNEISLRLESTVNAIGEGQGDDAWSVHLIIEALGKHGVCICGIMFIIPFPRIPTPSFLIDAGKSILSTCVR